MKASSSYSIEQLRNPEWTKKNGTAPSIMDYARYNYVAQPGDGAALMPKVGPYDYFAVNWGYQEFPKEADEKAELEKLVKLQINQPMFRFGDPNRCVDSTQQTEDLGSNAVEATGWACSIWSAWPATWSRPPANRARITSCSPTNTARLLGQWSREMGHVANVVGGVEEINLYYGDANRRFFPNSAAYQQQAVSFLLEHALSTTDQLHRRGHRRPAHVRRDGAADSRRAKCRARGI